MSIAELIKITEFALKLEKLRKQKGIIENPLFFEMKKTEDALHEMCGAFMKKKREESPIGS